VKMDEIVTADICKEGKNIWETHKNGNFSRPACPDLRSHHTKCNPLRISDRLEEIKDFTDFLHMDLDRFGWSWF
jgi:hypothetical protein